MGISSDLKNLKTHGTATAAELREFLAKTHGRSPQEVLGLVAESGLVKATIQCVIGCVLLMIATSAIPYAWNKAYPPDKATAAKPRPAAAKDKESTPVTDTQNAATVDSPSADKSKSPATDVDKAAKAMGIGDTKAADPKKNPLDKDLDKLLDDVK